MNNNIAVSVVVPVYNAEKYLVKCLDSITNQTLRNIEIIIIDDGSTDGSSDICNAFAKRDSRIVYVKKENEGAAATRQLGIDIAKGEYLGFVDSDDWLNPDMYERMFSVATENDADIVFCNCYLDEDKKDRIHLEPGIYNRKDIEEKILTRSLAEISLKGSNSVIRWCNWLRIYRTKLIRDNNIRHDKRFRRSQDLQLTFEATLYAQKFVSINDEYLCHNRTHDNDNSLSRGYNKNYWKVIRPLVDKLYDDVSLFPELNLINQMHLCTFFFAAVGTKNEYEKSNFKMFRKIKLLDEIAKDDVLQKALNHIDVKRLNNYYQSIYYGLCKKRGLSVYLKYWLYVFKRDKYKPFARKLINSKIIGTFFKKLK